MAHDGGFSAAARTWDARFDKPAYVFGIEPNAYLASQRAVLAGAASALAVADGEGRNSVWLAQQGLRVDAFDVSPVGVAKAAELARGAGVAVDLHVSSCDSWTWRREAYDVVAAIFVQFAPPDMRQRLFANIEATLKPGGHLILQGYTPRQLEYKTGGPGVLEHLYTEAMLREAFAGFEIVDLRAYDSVLAEGTGHVGRSALIGMVARKPLA